MPGTCIGITDQYGQERLAHGTQAFPAAIYMDEFQGEMFPWHWHDEMEINIVIDGPVSYRVGSHEATLQNGEGIYIKPGILHSFSPVGKSLRQYSLTFHPRLVGGEPESVFYQKYINPLVGGMAPEWIHFDKSAPWHEAVLHAALAAWKNMSEEPDGYEFQTRNLLSDIIFHISGHADCNSSIASAKQLRDYERIKRLLDHIHNHYMDRISTGALSAIAGISESECLRCFHSMLRTTPIRYLNHYRLSKAAALLKNSDRKVIDIGLQCGFDDMSYFAKAFKQVYGCTPKKYRQDEHVRR